MQHIFWFFAAFSASRVKGLNQEVWGQSEGQSKNILNRGMCNVPNSLRPNQSDSRVWSPTNWTTSQLLKV
jgi:hypothetical protein